ncbi:MAG: response regulator transcription factor [Alistipes sp.]|nr:response regulator transcription factor [Alistipes sp.]
MIRCLAIDDEPLALRQIKSYIERVADLELVELCSSAVIAQEVLQREKIDLMFVDINMPDLNGVDFVRELSSPPMVIFTTAYTEYAIEGFRLDAVDYLLKPFSFDEFSRAVSKAKSLFELNKLREKHSLTESSVVDNSSSNETTDCISIKADYKVTMVRYADIIYIESVGEYVRLHLNNASAITTLFRLKNMESALPSDKFMRVHRSYIVNLSHVTEYSRSRVMLDNGEYVPVSVNYRDAFREYIERSMPSVGV